MRLMRPVILSYDKIVSYLELKIYNTCISIGYILSPSETAGCMEDELF